jgi:CheY-specific phosphatase CheX
MRRQPLISSIAKLTNMAAANAQTNLKASSLRIEKYATTPTNGTRISSPIAGTFFE